MTSRSISIKLDVNLLIVSWFPFEINLAKKNSNVAGRNCKTCNSICHSRANMVQYDQGYTEEVLIFSSADQRSSAEIMVLLIFCCCGLVVHQLLLQITTLHSVFIGSFWILLIAEKQGTQSHSATKPKFQNFTWKLWNSMNSEFL